MSNDEFMTPPVDPSSVSALTRRKPPRAIMRKPARTRTASRPVEAAPREEIRDAPRQTGQERLYRRRTEGADAFFIDKGMIPPGQSYEWKRVSCYGEPDPQHQNNLRMNHWTPVPAARHPDLASDKTADGIMLKGMILMERPAYLTQEAIQESYQIATNEVRGAKTGLREAPGNTMSRDHPSAQRSTFVNTSYEPLAIVDK